MTRRAWLFLLLALGLAAFMPGSQSLWIDEAQTVQHVTPPTLGAWLANFLANKFSELLMPLGMFAAWLGGKVFGTGEWQLRAPNLVWTAVMLAAFARLGVLWRIPWAPLVVAVQPFLWFYANEARPYTLQMAGGAWLLAGLAEVLHEQRLGRRALWTLLLAGSILAGTTLFGILTTGAVVVIVAWLVWRNRWPLFPGWWRFAAAGLVWCLALGAFFVWGLLRGGKGAQLWSVGLSNLAFSAYEFGGFGGFGPGRDALRLMARTGGSRALLDALLPGAVPMAVLAACHGLFTLRLIGLWRAGRRRLEIGALTAALALSGGGLVVLAFVAHFPFWGRHFAPLFPFFCGLLLLAIAAETGRRSATRYAGFALAALLLASSLLFRFAPRHAKDDYRSAAAVARSALAAGESVWWSGDPEAARYYGVPLTVAAPQPGHATHINLATPASLATVPRPDVIISSKPDTFDTHGAMLAYAREHGFQIRERFKSFDIWRPAPQPH